MESNKQPALDFLDYVNASPTRIVPRFPIVGTLC